MAVNLTDSWLEELRGRSDLGEIVSEYVPLKSRGRRLWGRCPFHNEKTPSFSVDTEAQLYYCFGCHQGGSVIQFVMAMEHVEFMDAVRMLAERAHMEFPEGRPDPNASARREERERMLEANVQAARFYHRTLWTPDGAEVLKYLYGRGLLDADIRKFGLGATPHARDGLRTHLIEMGFEEDLLLRAGLLVNRDGIIRDMFQNRAMFPIINAQGRVLAFGGRALGDSKPKYLNTQETPVFNKRQGLYAMNMAKNERSLGHLVLVEGYMDVVSLRKNGVEGPVATLGTALTEEQARLIKRYVPEVWISYDGDSAGQHAALRALDILEAEGLATRVIDYPPGMDPDDFVKANGLKGFNALTKYPGIDYRLIRAKDGLDLNLQEGVTQYAMAACTILRRVKNPVELENYVRRLVNETGYDREVLMRQIGATQNNVVPERRPSVRRARSAETSTSPILTSERALISLLRAELIPADMLRVEDFSLEAHSQVFEALVSGRSMAEFVQSLEDDALRNEVMQAINYEPLPEDRKTALEMAHSSLRAIRRSRLEERIQKIKEEINAAPPERRQELYEQLGAIMREMDT